MTRTKGFWAAMAVICLTAVGFSGHAIYTRLTIHFANDTMEIGSKPVPPLPDPEEAEEPAATAAETGQPPAKNPAAAPGNEEPRKPKAVKTPFSYKSASAKRVFLAGSFTKWKETAMVKKNGVWKTDVYILPGNYLYHFVVDGKKTTDTGKTISPLGESVVTVKDGGAGEN